MYDYLVYKGYVNKNIILPFRKRYLRRYKKNDTPSVRKLISVEEMADFINSIIPIRDKAIAVLLAKTGIRRGELLSIEIGDVDFSEGSILLKPFHKRSNRLMFFDDETEFILTKWLKRRKDLANNGVTSLFVNDYGEPLGRSGVYNAIVGWAKKLGFYDSDFNITMNRASCPKTAL